MTRRSYFFETYGCQMNRAESEAMSRQLDWAGWVPARSIEQADLVVLNTCSVRKTAEDRIFGRLGLFKHMKTEGDFKLAVVGCLSQRLQNELYDTRTEIDLVMGSFQKHRFVEAVEQLFDTNQRILMTETRTFDFERSYSRPDAFKAFLPIMHGCNNFCTYCIVPYVRGPEVSRSPESILAEIRSLDARSVKEVTLLGQNVNSYRYERTDRRGGEGSLDFPALLRKIAANVRNIRWLRFLTSHPKDLSRDLIRVMRDERLMCRHLHLPVQHGSTSILRAMGRGYSREEYLGLVNEIKNAVSDLSITTDILIGFPGETEEDFEQTLDLMRAVRFDDAFTYRYNPREGTEAYSWGDTVPDEVKKRRLTEVIELQREITVAEKTRRLGRREPALVESRAKKDGRDLLARTERDDMVVLRADDTPIGELIDVRLLSLSGSTFVGEKI